MASGEESAFHRRALFRGGLTATVIGGLLAASPLAEATTRRPWHRVITEPEIFPTVDWEARPPAEEIVVEDHPPAYIVVHHTVEPGNTDDLSKERAFAISRAIQNFHMDSRGWIDTGQQFTISRGGYITEGRHRSLEILREGLRHVQGANVGNHNSQVIGIENEGVYTDEDVPRALWESLVDLVTYMAYQYDIPAELIKGHRDFNSTQCPGDVLYTRLPELRRTVARRLRQGLPPEQPGWPLLRSGDSGHQVRIAQRLLRDNGARGVPTDGVYGPSTQRAVAALAAANGIGTRGCTASAYQDEGGLLGSDLWPLLVTRNRSNAEWKHLLAGLTPD